MHEYLDLTKSTKMISYLVLQSGHFVLQAEGGKIMKKIYRATQLLLVLLFIAIIIVSGYSTMAVNILGMIGIVISLFYIFFHRKIKRDYVQD